MQSLCTDSIFAERYRIIRSMASGGMGSVYEVEHTETGRHLALKVLLPGLIENEASCERFRREARITANLECPFLVQVLDAGVDLPTSMPFIVMELLRGEDLSSRLHKHGAFSPATTLIYLHQVALALEFTHRAQIIHRDLKPENVFCTQLQDGSPLLKVLDFGLAKTIDEGSPSTSSTMGIGTPP